MKKFPTREALAGRPCVLRKDAAAQGGDIEAAAYLNGRKVLKGDPYTTTGVILICETCSIQYASTSGEGRIVANPQRGVCAFVIEQLVELGPARGLGPVDMQ